MPAKSKSQQKLMGACSHGVPLKNCPEHMSQAQMKDYARTPAKGLPERAPKRGR